MSEIQAGDTVEILSGNRKGERGKVIYVRMAPPNYSRVEACSVLCLDFNSAIYPARELKKV